MVERREEAHGLAHVSDGAHRDRDVERPATRPRAPHGQHDDGEDRGRDGEARAKDSQHVGAAGVGEASEDRHRPEGDGADRDEKQP